MVVHAASTWAMVGLIWFVQVVHYPLYDRVGGGFVDYHRSHMSRTGPVVGTFMLAEAGTGVAVALHWSGPPAAWALPWIGLALLAVAWLSTAALQVPAHGRLGAGFDARAHRRLVATNWIRTAAWSARGVLVAALLAL